MITVDELSKFLPKDITLDTDYKGGDSAIKPIVDILDAFLAAEIEAEKAANAEGKTYPRLLVQAKAAREENRVYDEKSVRGRAVSYGLNIFQVLSVSDVYAG